MYQMIVSQFWILKCVLRFLQLCIPPIDTLKAFHLVFKIFIPLALQKRGK